MPSTGGITGRDPVAMTKRRARISNSPATTVLRSAKRASAWMTRTPSAVKRSTESFGAIVAITSWTCRCTLRKSTSGSTGAMPNFAASRIACACRPAAIKALEGTQP